MIFLVFIFAILAIVISLILIDMGISDHDKSSVGIGSAVLVLVLIVGGFFYAGIKIPLVALSLMIGLPICYNACKSLAYCSKQGSYSLSDKIIGSAIWAFSMIFLTIAFYYWYYIPEHTLLMIALIIVATVAFVYAIYWLFKGGSHFLPALTAFVFAAIVFYYGEVRELLPLNAFLKVWTEVILVVIGLRYLIGFIHTINVMHEPLEEGGHLKKGLVFKSFFLFSCLLLL